MSQNKSNIAVIGLLGVVAISIVFFAVSAYKNMPQIIKGTGPVKELEITPNCTTVILNQGAKIEEAIDLGIFENFSFTSSSSEAEELLGSSAGTPKKVDDYCRYDEYIRPHSRIRFYQCTVVPKNSAEIIDEHWIEVFPSTLLVDKFFKENITKHLDLSQVDQTVYICNDPKSEILAEIKGNHVSRIRWTSR